MTVSALFCAVLSHTIRLCCRAVVIIIAVVVCTKKMSLLIIGAKDFYFPMHAYFNPHQKCPPSPLNFAGVGVTVGVGVEVCCRGSY